jgi:ankyrin repeat protein
MFELAGKVAHYTVLHATASDRIKKLPRDDHRMRDLKRNLHMLYVGLHKTLLLATAQLTISLYSDWQFINNIVKHYDWEGQIKELDDHHQLCKDYRDEMIARQKDPSATKPEQSPSMGPGPRNPLHWAVALGVPEQVTHLIQKNEYPINALTPRKWTAAHLAAEQGNTNVMKTLLTVPGIDLKIKNSEGHTPLHVAAVENKPGAAQLLLQRDGTLLGRYDHRGRTACSIAAYKGHVDILAVLREYGQDFNEVTGANGWTALHLAAENGHVEVVKYLLAHGANKDITVRDGKNKGLTVKDVAEQNKKLGVVVIL